MSHQAHQADATETPGQRARRERAWRGEDFQAEQDWVTHLLPEEVQELEQIAAELPPRSAEWVGMKPDQMTRPLIESRLQGVARELGDGRGFALIRGLDASEPETLRGMFWAIGNHLGTPVMQNTRGEILSEVRDLYAGAPRGIDTRGFESNDELRFHADGGDCIGMACVRQAPSGGANGLVSLLSIYNELLAHHPEHLDVLCRGFPLYVRKEKGAAGSRLGKVNEKRIPVFAWERGHMSAWLNLKLAEIAAQVSGSRMSHGEQAALECLEEIAERPELKLSFRQRPGDVLFVHNLAVMHRRDRYTDDPAPAESRLLYRMWTNLHEPRPVVPAHARLRHGIPGPRPVVVGP